MGKRTGRDPSFEDSFLWRICHALDQPPRMLASSIGVEYGLLEPMLDDRHRDGVDDEVFAAIMEYVSSQLSVFIAVKEELNRALYKQRVKQISRGKK